MIKKQRTVKSIHEPSNIDGLIPGVRGQRAFPSPFFRDSDPFLMLDHIGPQHVGKDWVLDGSGHDHPHRGFETITFMFEGSMQHRDSIGNRAELQSGSAQRMNAGSGIIHGGDMASDTQTGRFHEVQLWINNPSTEKMSVPEIHNVAHSDIPSLKQGPIRLKLYAGSLNGLQGPLSTKAETSIGQIEASDSGAITLTDISEDHHLMIYVLEGQIKVNGKILHAFELADFNNDGSDIAIHAEKGTNALVLSGKPLNEPVAFGGPFVMNTQEEIREAQLDYQLGKFGAIK